MLKKGILIAALTALVAAMAVAKGADDAAEAVTVKVAYPVAVDAPVAAILEGYAQEFMELHPEVVVEPVYAGGYGDVKTMVQTTIDGGGEAPALAVMLATDLFDLANAQYIEPLSAFVDAMDDGDAYIADFLPAFMANSQYIGDIWSLPFQRSAVILYYNADLLDEAGLAVPSDWDSLAQAASSLTVNEDGNVTRWGIEWPSGWPYWLFQPLAIANGRNIVGDDDAMVYFDDPAVIEAIEYYISLSADHGAMPAGVQASWGNVVPNFVSANTAMIVHSSGSLSSILSQADFQVGVMAVPGPRAGQAASVPGGGNLYMVAGLSEAEQQAAFDLAVFLTDASKAADFSIATGYIATSAGAAADSAMVAYAAENPQVGDVVDALSSAGKELATQNLAEVRSIFHSAIQSAFNGDMSASDAMAQAQAQADAALVDFR